MNLAKAKQVGAAVVDAGYQATLDPKYVNNEGGEIDPDGWRVLARSPRPDVTLNAAKSLQDTHAVNGFVKEVIYT